MLIGYAGEACERPRPRGQVELHLDYLHLHLLSAMKAECAVATQHAVKWSCETSDRWFPRDSVILCRDIQQNSRYPPWALASSDSPEYKFKRSEIQCSK